LYGGEIEYEGNIELDYKEFRYQDPSLDTLYQKTISSELRLKKQFDNHTFVTKFKALKDKDDKDRKYHRIDEGYYKYKADNYSLQIGKSIRYWGVLEYHNLTDIYNKHDKYDDDQMGRENLTYNYIFLKDDTISLIISKDKTQDNDNSAHLKYSGRSDIWQTNQNFSYILSSVDKSFLMFHKIIYGDMIYKIEYLYKQKTKKYQTGTGIEYLFHNIYKTYDLSLMTEYYKSDEQDISYQKNLFIGTKLKLNNTYSSEISTGIIKDYIKDEYSKTVEIQSKFYKAFKTKISYFKNDDLSIVNLELSYHF
jgi:hypothetical protein